MSPCSNVPTNWKGDTALPSTRETVLEAKKPDDTNCDYEKLEEPQVGYGHVSEQTNKIIAAALQEVIADDIKQQVEKALAAFQGSLKKLLSRSYTLPP